MTNNPDGLSDARALLRRAHAHISATTAYENRDGITRRLLADIMKALATPPASTSTAIAAGFVMVLAEPTESMLVAGGKFLHDPSLWEDSGSLLRAVWSAMLTAAPTAPKAASENGATGAEKMRETAAKVADEVAAAEEEAGEAGGREWSCALHIAKRIRNLPDAGEPL